MATQSHLYISVEEYLAQEAIALDRHEYLNGEKFLMAGGTLNHSAIGANVITSLSTQLADSDCIVRGSDALIRTSPSGLFSYADAVVSCGVTQTQDNMLLNPMLIVEVLSESTESYDRGKKFEFYRQIESFTEYIIIAQDRVYVEHHVKRGDTWIMRECTDRASVLVLDSVKASLALFAIYAKVL